MSFIAKHKENTTSLLGDTSYAKYSALSLNDPAADAEPSDQTTTVRRKTKDTHTVLELKQLPDRKSPELKDPNTVLLYEEIKDGDTLQSISLRFGCTVNEIKRANGLITEQDFYARKTIKIPVNRYSLLTVPEEKLRQQEEHAKFFSVAPLRNSIQSAPIVSQVQTFHTAPLSQQNSLLKADNRTPPSDFDSSESLEEAIPLLTSASQERAESPSMDANKYLKKLDKDIRKTVKKADLHKELPNESLDEVLSSMQYYPVDPITQPNKRNSNGADCGMKWWTVIICFFIILIIIIALALFEYYHSEED